MRETPEGPGVAGLERTGSRAPARGHPGAGGPRPGPAEVRLPASRGAGRQPHCYRAAGAAGAAGPDIGKNPPGPAGFPFPRHFRRAYGTSPDRYRTRRRLDLGRAAIEHGTPLAQAAPEAGFADQSHMTRQFKQAYGLTAARWASAVKLGAAKGTIAHEPR